MSVDEIQVLPASKKLKTEHSFTSAQLSGPPSDQTQSQDLTHPTIRDGWFIEENDEWPGQAFQLQVKKILHVGKSKYQDVSFLIHPCTVQFVNML